MDHRWSTVMMDQNYQHYIASYFMPTSLCQCVLQELHERTVTLMEGSAFSEADLLGRAHLPEAAAALVLADRFSSNAGAEDTDVQFRVWAIKSCTKKVPLYVQVSCGV